MKQLYKPLARSTVWRKIRRLDLPEVTKQKLRDLWAKSRALCQALVTWLYERREFCTSVMLGIALAYLVQPLPVLGPILSTLCIALSVLYGIGKQFQADMNRHFRFVVEGRRV